MRRRHGFTLVELLVVIGIIAVLLSILLPVLRKARDQANIAVCAGNERQIYHAMVMYAQDNRGILPIPLGITASNLFPFAAIRTDGPGVYSYTVGTMWPYVSRDVAVRQNVFLCPGDGPDRGVHLGTTVVDAPGITRNFTYSFNDRLLGVGIQPLISGVRLSQIRGSDHKMLVLEGDDPQEAIQLLCTVDDQNNFRSLLSRRHFGRGNQCFADGHVELFDDRVLWDGQGVQQHHLRHFGVLVPAEGAWEP